MTRNTNLKRIQIAVHKQLKKIETVIEKREETYLKRSDKWQDSDNGELYESDTTELDSVEDYLKDAVNILQEITNFKIK